MRIDGFRCVRMVCEFSVSGGTTRAEEYFAHYKIEMHNETNYIYFTGCRETYSLRNEPLVLSYFHLFLSSESTLCYGSRFH